VTERACETQGSRQRSIARFGHAGVRPQFQRNQDRCS